MKLNGPGKYDDVCTLVRKMVEAQAVMVMVIDGSKGHGFSVQLEDKKRLKTFPKMLRFVADQIEKDVGG